MVSGRTCLAEASGLESEMPKMKSVSGAKKRFRKSGSGAFKRFKCGKSHILTKKTTKRKRRLRKGLLADPTNVKALEKMLPYA